MRQIVRAIRRDKNYRQFKGILLFGLEERHVAGNPKQKSKYYKQLTKSNPFGQIFFVIIATIENVEASSRAAVERTAQAPIVLRLKVRGGK